MAEKLDGIAYLRSGEGEPLLLIHGLGGTRGIWEPQLGTLTPHRDVIAIDIPGFGDSAALCDDEPASAAALARKIADFCAALGVERPHVAGNSLGGWLALELAKHDRARSLCLISPAGLWRRPLGPQAVNIRGLAKLMKPALLGLVRSEGARRRMLRTVVGKPENVPVEDAAAMVQAWVDAPGYESANSQMRKNVFEGVERIRVPTTIAHGELDRLVSPPKPDRRPRGSRFIILEGCGHTPNWDNPELVSRVLLEASEIEREGAAA